MVNSWSFFLFGLAMMLIFAFQLVRYVNFRGRSVRVAGRVVDLKKSSNGNYHPILEFTTAEGRDVRTRMRAGSRPAPARRGQSVFVVYDPQNPTEAEISNKGLDTLGDPGADDCSRCCPTFRRTVLARRRPCALG